MQTTAEAMFRELYQQHQRAIVAYFLRRTDVATARDAAAETFLVAWRRIEEIPSDAARPWLYGVARNVLANVRRSKRRSDALDARLRSADPPQSLSPETVIVRRVEDNEILEAVGRLRPEDRDVLLLAIWEELPYRDIATALGTSPNAIAQRMRRITKRLGHDLERADRPSAESVTSHRAQGGE